MLVKSLLFVLAVLHVGVETRLLSPFTSFTKELTFFDNVTVVLSSSNVVTEKDSFVYAVCGTNKCNATIETPAFEAATYTETCGINLESKNRSYEILTDFKIYPFGDDKILFSWIVKDSNLVAKMAKIRIIHWSGCEFQDLVLPAPSIFDILTYNNTFDVIMANGTAFQAQYRKIAYDVNGKKVSGPTVLGPEITAAGGLKSIRPVSPDSPAKGFYIVSGAQGDALLFQYTNSNLNVLEKRNITGSGYLTTSNDHQSLSVCSRSRAGSVTCWRNEGRENVNMKMVKVLGNAGPGYTWWAQPHNLADRGLLLVGGQVNLHNPARFESFSISKIQPDGRHERPLHVEGLDFTCTNIMQFHLAVSENDYQEICLHFACQQIHFDKHGIRNTLKFSTKCLPARHLFPHTTPRLHSPLLNHATLPFKDMHISRT